MGVGSGRDDSSVGHSAKRTQRSGERGDSQRRGTQDPPSPTGPGQAPTESGAPGREVLSIQF